MQIFTARFPGDCRACQGRIRRGDLITGDRRLGYVHADCRNPARVPAAGSGADPYTARGSRFPASWDMHPEADRDPGFVDLDRMFEDQCAEITGR